MTDDYLAADNGEAETFLECGNDFAAVERHREAVDEKLGDERPEADDDRTLEEVARDATAPRYSGPYKADDEQLGDERTAEEREEDDELIDRDVKEAQNRGL